MEKNTIAQFKSKANKVFEKLGFIPTYVGIEKAYEYKGVYHKLTHLRFPSGMDFFVIECAGSYDEACKNIYEDADLLPLSLGEKEFLFQLEDLLIKHYTNQKDIEKDIGDGSF